jgi:hypothetical protein
MMAGAPGRPSFERLELALGDRITRHGASHLDARCPAHEDHAASLSVDWKPPDAIRAGRVLLHCFAGCPQDAIRDALGLAPAELFDGRSPERPLGRARPRQAPRGLLPASDRTRPVPQPRSGDPGAPDHRGRFDYRSPEARHVYPDAGGVAVARVDRVRCADPDCPSIGAKGKPCKTFVTRRPDGSKGKPAGLDGLLYRLPDVLAAIAAGHEVYLCEGEGDADAIAAAGGCGTSAYGGAARAWHPRYTQRLMGARVVIVADRDAAGYRRAAVVAAALGAVPDSVRIVHALAGQPGADVSDHLAAGHALAELADCDPAAELARLGTSAAEPDPSVTRIGPEPRPIEGSPDWQFTPSGDDGTPGAIERLMGRGADRHMAPVITACPRVLERLVTAADSTTKARRHYTIRWGADEATISYADLISGEGWDKFPDAIGTGDKPVRAALANVVMTQGAGLPRTLAATRTGWHTDPGGASYYLYADGRTFPPGRPVRLIGAPARLAEAARPRGTAADAEIRQALEDIREHGRFAGLLGLAAGVRSLGQSIRPVPAALAPHGDPYAGKTLIGWHARSVMLSPSGARVEGWPPLPTKSFSATRTDLEFAANFEADLPALFEDLALPGNASAIEVREANGKLEALIRPLANQDEIRGRRSRDLLPGPANYVRSIPVITAERMPPTMMESLYRRAVVPRLRVGQIDTGWYAANSPRLLTPLRTIGDRIIARLFELGDDAAGRLGECGAAAYGVLGASIGNAGWLTSTPAMSGVVDGAAAILGGLYLVADVVPGVDPAALAEPVAAYLAEALAEQAAVMSDRHDDSGSLAEATAHVLTRALATRRAHVCDATGQPSPLIPGMAASEQGLIETGGFDPSYRGDGLALYWLPERGGVGIRSKALAALLAEARDPRAAGLTYRSLPEALLRDGASIRNQTQKGRSATHLVTVSGHDVWLILLHPDVFTGQSRENTSARSSDSNDRNDRNDRNAGQSAINDLQGADREKIDRTAGQGQAAPGSLPACGEPGPSLNSPATVPIVPTDSAARSDSERFAAPAVVADADGAYLAGADAIAAVAVPEVGAVWSDVLEWAAGQRLGLDRERGHPEDGQLVVMPDLAARLGLPAAAPSEGTKGAREHPALAAVRAAGWNVAELRSWMSLYRKGGRTLRVWLPGWDTPDECPMLEGGPSSVQLAYRLGRFAAVTGITWRLNGGPTGTDLALTFPRRKRLIGQPSPPKPALVPTLEADCLWQRAPAPDEAALGWVHVYDANAMYVAAAGLVSVGTGDPVHAESPEFDPALPGYWRLEPPDPANRFLPDLFDPTGRNAADGRRGARWFATPTLALAAELDETLTIAPSEGWLYREHSRFYEPWAARIRDARAELKASPDPDDATVLDAVKHTYTRGLGMLNRRTSRQMFRPDHWHAIVSTARGTLFRKLARIGDQEGRWPLAIGTDAVAYASADPDPRAACPAGLRIGEALGEFKVYGMLPMAEAVPLLRPGGRPGELLAAAHRYYLAHYEGDRHDG